jgi:hypothetical protein
MLDRINSLLLVKVEILTCAQVMSQLVLLGASWCYLVPVGATWCQLLRMYEILILSFFEQSNMSLQCLKVIRVQKNIQKPLNF